jgi:uncharacterized protein (DUF2384 family)
VAELTDLDAVVSDRLRHLGRRPVGCAPARPSRQEVPDSVRGLIREVAESIEHLGDREIAHVDPYLVIALQRATIAARNALDSSDLAQERRRLRIALEQMRHALRDLAENQPVADERSAKEIARWMLDILGVSASRIAGVIGVGPRTFERWASETDATAPQDAAEARLRVAARLVNHLRHTLTGSGAVTWLERPRAELDGRSPAEALDDPEALARLTALASGLRSSGAD